MNLRPVPFEKGNKLGERHGFYSQVLTPVDQADVAEIADALRELSPLDSDALEPLVRPLLWRIRRLALRESLALGLEYDLGKPVTARVPRTPIEVRPIRDEEEPQAAPGLLELLDPNGSTRSGSSTERRWALLQRSSRNRQELEDPRQDRDLLAPHRLHDLLRNRRPLDNQCRARCNAAEQLIESVIEAEGKQAGDAVLGTNADVTDDRGGARPEVPARTSWTKLAEGLVIPALIRIGLTILQGSRQS